LSSITLSTYHSALKTLYKSRLKHKIDMHLLLGSVTVNFILNKQNIHKRLQCHKTYTYKMPSQEAENVVTQLDSNLYHNIFKTETIAK
jgi:hypothetical protein